jgi:hypothetical protein
MVLSSTMDYLEWIAHQNPSLGISWLVNYIETTRKIAPQTPEMTIARDIAANNSLGCGLLRKRNNDTPMTINEACRCLHNLIDKDKNKRKDLDAAIRNIEIRGIITDVIGFRIVNWCGNCKRRVKTKICVKCGSESIARLQVFGQVSDPTGTIQFYGEDRVAEILLSAHPAQIVSKIDIQRGILFTIKYHLKQPKNAEKNKINLGNPWNLLSTLVNSIYAENLIGLPVCMAGNLELTNNNGKKKIMKIFWFETKTYQEEVIDLEKRSEIKQGSKTPLIAKRIECLRIM